MREAIFYFTRLINGQHVAVYSLPILRGGEYAGSIGYLIIPEKVPSDPYVGRAARPAGPAPAGSSARGLTGADEDPLEKLIGSVHSDMPGWADRHDEYLGRFLADELRGGATEGK